VHLILQYDVEGVDDAWDVTKNGQENVNKEIRITATLEEDTDRGQEDSEYDLDDV